MEAHEDWAKRPEVLELMRLMLAYPEADHSAAVCAVLDGPILLGHAVGVCRAAKQLNKCKSKWHGATTTNGGVAYHIWLYHFLGGAGAKLHAAHVAGAQRSKALFSAAVREEDAFSARVRTLLKTIGRAAAAGQSTAFVHKELAELRSKIVPLSLLQWSDCGTLAVGSGATVAAAPSAIVAAGPSPSPPPAESEKEWRQQTALLLAFAMGTHARLGEGYASRDGPCAVRLVARNEDVLRQIAAHVRDLPPHILAPPDRETLRLRRLQWQLEQELRAERSASEELRVQLADAGRERARGVRREELAAAALEQALKLARAQAEAAAKDVKKENRQLRCENAHLKALLSAEQRASKRSLANMEVEHSEELERHESEAVARLREQEHELREYQLRMHVERNEAQQRAADLDVQAQKLSDSLERLRSTSKSGLLAEVRAAIARLQASRFE